MTRSSRLCSLLILVLTLPCQAIAGDTLTGKVTDSDGAPLAGVRVDVATAAPKVGRGYFCPSCYLDCEKWALSDDQGNFELTGLDPTLKFSLIAAASGKESSQTKHVDPLAGDVTIVLEPLPEGIDPGRIVSGIVTQRGEPVVGAVVHPHGAKTPGRRWFGRVEEVKPTVTDSDGGFSMILPEDFMGLDVEVTGSGFCGQLVSLLEPGKTAEIEVQNGATVTGRIVRDGKPVAGLSIAVVQTDRGSSSERIFLAAIGAVTNDKGEFEFRHLPPSEQYCIYSVVGDARRTESPYILSAKLFGVPGHGETRDLGALEAEEPITLRGRVERTDGKPLPDNLKLSLGRDPAWDLVAFPVAADGTFEMTGLPRETYEVRVADRELVLDTRELEYQPMGPASFGLYLDSSLDDLTIQVKGK